MMATITGNDWKRSLTAARVRRAPEATAARMFRGPACPVCQRPGIHHPTTGGVRIVHGADSCWMPSAESVAAAGLVGSGTRLGGIRA